MAKPKNWAKYRILETCEALHMQITGAGDWCETWDVLMDMASWLTMRNEKWKDSPAFCRKYDSIIRELIGQTLRDWEDYIIRMKA